MSSLLFGDELNEEVEELTKSRKLSNKVTPKGRMEPYRVPSGVEVCVVVAALARVVVMAKPLQVLFWGEVGVNHGPSRVPSNNQQRLCWVVNRGQPKFCRGHYCKSNSF